MRVAVRFAGRVAGGVLVLVVLVVGAEVVVFQRLVDVLVPLRHPASRTKAYNSRTRPFSEPRRPMPAYRLYLPILGDPLPLRLDGKSFELRHDGRAFELRTPPAGAGSPARGR